jgi:hypothetical protein
VAPAEVLFNLRSGQQIGLSAGIADTGMNAGKPDEGLLNPFENTGAVALAVALSLAHMRAAGVDAQLAYRHHCACGTRPGR